MTEKQDIIEQTARQYENRSDDEFDLHKSANEFPLCGHEKRAQILDYIDGAMDQRLEEGDLRKIAELYSVQKRLHADHKKLRAAKR